MRRLDGLAAAGGARWTATEVASERRRATSADGTEVPYFLLRRADLPLDGPRPTLLYGYGGFDIPISPTSGRSFAGWLAAGGVLAIANLRGGGEYGAAWHDAGRLAHKQNVFDDFAAVADHLVAEGVTTRAQLALHGGSNGGLLVGATMTQRPDLAAVALPAVGVMDMLRFHLFTIGAAWIADYGSPEDPDEFETLLAYSPLHNAASRHPLPGDPGADRRPRRPRRARAQLQVHRRAPARPGRRRARAGPDRDLDRPRPRQAPSVVAAETADLLAFAAEHTGLVPG